MTTDERDEFGQELDPADRELLDTAASAGAAVPPPGALRDRLLASVRHSHRWDDLLPELAKAMCLSVDEAARVLVTVDRPDGWEDAPFPGVRLLDFEGGPGTEDAITGFVRIEPGASFPHHEHVGHEIVVVLQGSCVDSEGTEYFRGQRIDKAPGTAHAITVTSDIPLLYMAVVQDGLILGGQHLRKGDPRV